MIEILRDLSEISGPSGKEEGIRKYIKRYAGKYMDEINEDSMGNLYLKKGKGRPRVLLCAHMDEVGFIVKSITEEGFLRFNPLGGISPQVCVGKRVIFENGRKGVIGYAPFHLQKKDGEHTLSFDELVIDVGMGSKKEVGRVFQPGDCAVFDTSFGVLYKNLWKGKAFDDRAGCCILMEIAKNFIPDFELILLFSVQEELGLRGARIGGERVKPDLAIIVEGTASGDFYQGEKKDFPVLGKGPVFTLLDRSCIVDKEVLTVLEKIAKKNKIPFQYKKPLIGGTDAGMIQLTGSKTAIISVPVRYIHSPVSILHKQDLRNTYSLLIKFLKGVKRIWRQF